MNYFTNQLHRLENENKYAFQKVSEAKSRQEITKMLRYISASALSLYQIQIIKKDLIGMAIEAETEHMTLEDKLGVDYKDFCDEIILTADKSAIWEHIMRYVLTILQAFSICFAAKFILLNSAPVSFGIDYSDLVWLFIWCIGGIFLPEYLEQKLAISPCRYRRLPSLLCRILAFFCFALLIATPLSTRYVISGNGWLILTVLLLLLLAATVAMNLHWEKCSQKYSH